MHPKTDLHKYQVDLISFIKKHHKCGAFLDMGMGKTAVALTAALDLLRPFCSKSFDHCPIKSS